MLKLNLQGIGNINDKYVLRDYFFNVLKNAKDLFDTYYLTSGYRFRFA